MAVQENDCERTGRRSRIARAGDRRQGNAVVVSADSRSLELERERQRRRVLEERLALLVESAAELQEEERRRIARDVHDHMGQQMTALRIQLELLYSQCTSPSQLERLQKTQSAAEALDRGLDDLIRSLRSVPPLDVDLGDTLSTFVKGWSAEFGIAAECALSPDGAGLPQVAALNLYAIAQEALHNVVKHARATSVRISVTRRDDGMVLRIEDDGCGFNSTYGGARASGFGLLSMSERAELAGGLIEITSAPGRGTTVAVFIPFTCSTARVEERSCA
jgi:two-component system, NarL family, sensor histidine kinase UhpB